MGILYSRFEELFEQFLEKLPELLFALIVLVLFHFLAKGGRKVYKNILDKTPLTSSNVNFFGKLIYALIFLIGILVALNILGLSGIATSILASGGITAVILGFAFKDIGENFLASFFMAFSRPFTNGDLIATEGVSVVYRILNYGIRIFAWPMGVMCLYQVRSYLQSHCTIIRGMGSGADRLQLALIIEMTPQKRAKLFQR
jgi:small-conductance mechanosensitive channel